MVSFLWITTIVIIVKFSMANIQFPVVEQKNINNEHENMMIQSVDYDPGTTVCILPSGARYLNVNNCTNGEIFLIGKYINLGVHNVASFGTIAPLGASYFPGQLGFIADFDKNGFATSSPGFAGDYFIPGIPFEGKIIYWYYSIIIILFIVILFIVIYNCIF